MDGICECNNWDIDKLLRKTGGHHSTCPLSQRPDVLFLSDEAGELLWSDSRINNRDFVYIRLDELQECLIQGLDTEMAVALIEEFLEKVSER